MIYYPVIKIEEGGCFKVVGFKPNDPSRPIWFEKGKEFNEDSLIIPVSFVGPVKNSFLAYQTDLEFGDILFFGDVPHMVILNNSYSNSLQTLPLFHEYAPTTYVDNKPSSGWAVSKINRLFKKGQRKC